MFKDKVTRKNVNRAFQKVREASRSGDPQKGRFFRIAKRAQRWVIQLDSAAVN